MQIVIDIDKNLYNAVKDPSIDSGYYANECYNAVLCGTPLPKRHEKIISTDIIKDFKNKIKHYGKDYKFTQEEILNILERYEIKYAPAIIEADKE